MHDSPQLLSSQFPTTRFSLMTAVAISTNSTHVSTTRSIKLLDHLGVNLAA
jgi:hypothetical protein